MLTASSFPRHVKENWSWFSQQEQDELAIRSIQVLSQLEGILDEQRVRAIKSVAKLVSVVARQFSATLKENDFFLYNDEIVQAADRASGQSANTWPYSRHHLPTFVLPVA
jgi:hypothetical protein